MLALLYDIHGNLPALDAVLDDARTQGADRWLLGGDYAVFGGWPAATIGIALVGPGSVGIPMDGDQRAAYALLHEDARIERRRVAYDHAASAARVREAAAGAPWGETIARRIERAEG